MTASRSDPAYKCRKPDLLGHQEMLPGNRDNSPSTFIPPHAQSPLFKSSDAIESWTDDGSLSNNQRQFQDHFWVLRHVVW